MKKVYDIMITEGEDKGRCRMMGIKTQERAALMAKLFEPSCVIVEREVEDEPTGTEKLQTVWSEMFEEEQK